MNIVVSGGTGFIGSRLRPALEAAGHTVRVWSRSGQDGSLKWDPVSGIPPEGSLDGVDAVVYLSGESVAKRWNDELKKKIRDSRVKGVGHLIDGISAAAHKPRVLVCSSATGYYGDRGEEELVETSAPGDSFLAGVCQEWERAADRAMEIGLRVVKIRTGVVLGSGGGAVDRLVSAFKSKMGGKLGSGKQWMPWIHMSDSVGIYKFAVENEVSGVLNGTAPHPARNEALTEALGQVMGEPTKMTVPEFALKMMFGEMSEVLLGSQKVLPEATLKSGYEFRYTDVKSALQDAVHPSANDAVHPA